MRPMRSRCSNAGLAPRRTVIGARVPRVRLRPERRRTCSRSSLSGLRGSTRARRARCRSWLSGDVRLGQRDGAHQHGGPALAPTSRRANHSRTRLPSPFIGRLRPPSRRHSLRQITPCSILLSSVRFGDHSAQPRILLLELPQLLHFGWHQPAIELFPAIERRFRDAHLASHLGNLRSTPLSACWSANAICCSLNFDLFIGQLARD